MGVIVGVCVWGCLCLLPHLQGMRIVHDPTDFSNLLAECRSESLKSFGDDTIMVEKFVPHPR